MTIISFRASIRDGPPSTLHSMQVENLAHIPYICMLFPKEVRCQFSMPGRHIN
jgi:hypothetical protein